MDNIVYFSMCTVAFRRMMSAWLRFDILFKLSKYWTMQKEALKVIHGTTHEVIRKRKLQMKDNPNLRQILEGDEDFSKYTLFAELIQGY